LFKKLEKWIFEELLVNSKTEILSTIDNNNSVFDYSWFESIRIELMTAHSLLLVDVTIKYTCYLWFYFKLNIKLNN